MLHLTAAEALPVTATRVAEGLAGLGRRVLLVSPDVPYDATEPAMERTQALVLAAVGGGFDMVVVDSPPPLSGIAAGTWVVVGAEDGRCDLGAVLAPLQELGLAACAAGGDPDLILVVALPCLEDGSEEPPSQATPDGAPDLLQRTYHLQQSTVEALRIAAATIGARSGRHMRQSRVVALAIRYAPVLDRVERIVGGGALMQRTYHLRPATVQHLAQLALLASRLSGRHVRLSAVVDLAIRLFCALPPDEQDAIIARDAGRRPGNRA